jgi:hypothetical protein
MIGVGGETRPTPGADIRGPTQPAIAPVYLSASNQQIILCKCSREQRSRAPSALGGSYREKGRNARAAEQRSSGGKNDVQVTSSSRRFGPRGWPIQVMDRGAQAHAPQSCRFDVTVHLDDDEVFTDPRRQTTRNRNSHRLASSWQDDSSKTQNERSRPDL